MTAKKRKKKAPTPLDGFFHYTEHGGTFSGEMAAGVGMALLAVCGMFMNMQLVGQLLVTPYADSSMSQVAVNGELYAMTWLASMIVAFVGTLVMGLVARLPFVQVTSLSLSCVLVSTVSLNTGLTYYNMLAICFVSNIVYLIIAAVPALRRFVYAALPKPVRAALPAAAGLLMAWIAAQLSGLFSVSSTLVPNYGTAANLGSGYAATSAIVPFSSFSFMTDAYHPQMLLSGVAVIVALVIFAVSRRRSLHPCLRALVWGTVFFLVASILACGVNWNNFNLALSFLWGRLWMVGAEDAMQAHFTAALGNLSIGRVLTEGFDFSGFTDQGGNLVTLMATGVLSYLFLFLYDAESTVVAVSNEHDAKASDVDAAALEAPGEKDLALPLMLNAGVNVAAGIVGASPVALGKESVAGAKDRARSGLSAVVAAVVFAISAVVWIVPALFSTIVSYSIAFNMYGHYGYTMQLLTQSSFAVADAVMMVVGLSMMVRSFTIDVRDPSESVPFMATVAFTLLFTNLAAGVAAGTVAHVLVNLQGPRRSRKKKGKPAIGLIERVGGVPTLVWAVVSCALLVLLAV